MDKLNLELEQKVKQRTRELEKMTITDELTDLFNRRHILDLLEIEIKKASRYNRNLSVIMIDIDFFKKVNDNHGHQFGD
ncbi:GGDEF domain-containing protein, partial [Halanaerobium saccharolyticum]|uniref:GGDEF domain-containing protein n=1 Tax=Halanaerobium saccharolyticum TaxID=43595 RepID=UPI001266F364